MARTINRTRRSPDLEQRTTLVMTLLEGPDHFNGHCTCDRWSYRTADWADLGMKWAWHYVAESEGPDGHPLIRRTVKAELEASGDYGGDCAGCGHPVVRGRTLCRDCEQEAAVAAGGRPRRQLRAQLLLGGHRRQTASRPRRRAPAGGLPQLRQLPRLRR